MSERFFVDSTVSGDRAVLTGDEARHLARIMRAAVGDEVILFDGSGAEFVARIVAIGRSAVELAIVERRTIDRELPFRLILAVALPKGDRQRWLVEKATELGVTRLVPLGTERGVAQPVESALARLRRVVIESSKQCGRNRLMEIGEPVAAGEWFAREGSAFRVQTSEVRGQRSAQTGSGVDSGQGTVHSQAVGPESAPDPFRKSCLRLIAEPSGQALASLPLPAGDVIAAIGPEGGFTPHELAAAIEHGWQSVSLGKSILRVETAALALAAWAALR